MSIRILKVLGMRKIILLLLFIGTNFNSIAQDIVPLIPRPVKATKQALTFTLDQHTQISINDESKEIASYLQAELLRHKGISLRTIANGNTNCIHLQLTKNSKKAPEGYELSIAKNKIEIKAAHHQGLFAGVNSLLQLIRQQKAVNNKIILDGWSIEDQPLYSWRGVMLDESRHFFGMEKVKQILDWMAFYKLNKFHWHLTDQSGWRIEIKAYPKLTVIGGVGNHTDSLAKAQYYTQEQIKEIVRYAFERCIEVIPEIDMPGHATAANRAYPAFSGGGTARNPEFTFNPGKEETYQYLTNILREVDALFPSQMIHIGADEVHFGNQHWNQDEAVQKLMKRHNFKSLPEAEAYFVQRMADSVKSLNNEVLAWDEIVRGNMSTDRTTVLWWRHDKPEVLKEAIKKGYKVILCPRIPLYFDFVQDSSHVVGRKWGGKFVPIQSVYDFPTADVTDLPGAVNLIQGMQGNIWTEALVDRQQIDYMLFPRIAALAEAAWTNKDQKSLVEFNTRLRKHFDLYTEGDLYFFNPFEPKKSPELLTPSQRKGLLPDNEAQTAREKLL